MGSQFEEVVQIFEVKRVGGAPKGHQFTSLSSHENTEDLSFPILSSEL